LVLQGGGALGAYQVGVLKVLCKKLLKSRGSDEDSPLFDIIAGSSIGAMNAAVLVGNIVNRDKTWKQAVDVLEDFWMNEKTGLSSTPDISKLLDSVIKKNFSASSEAARRYYSVQYYLANGTQNICSTAFEKDSRFGDWDKCNNHNPLQRFWYTSDPLRQTIEQYSKAENTKELKIATNGNEKQPRLLVISVDVGKGKTVTFDSYYKKTIPTIHCTMVMALI
jgi:NTE family protein